MRPRVPGLVLLLLAHFDISRQRTISSVARLAADMSGRRGSVEKAERLPSIGPSTHYQAQVGYGGGAQMRLEGNRALVTGAQQGIGRAAVLALARNGADVAINWFEAQDAAEELAAEVRALQRRAVTVQGDVSKSADVSRFVEEAHRALGGIDILINNAGVFPRSPFLELAEAEWDHVLDVNLKGSFLVAQAVARKMVADECKGAIVNISSSSVRGHILGVHYSASKNGIIGITRSMALALAPHGIRVNAVARASQTQRSRAISSRKPRWPSSHASCH